MIFRDMDLEKINTPCYIVDERLLKKNMEVLKDVMDKTDCKILLAQKGFSMYSEYKFMSNYLKGTTASSLHELKLGYEEFPGEVHIFNPAYREDEMDEILEMTDHMVFNSFTQWYKYKDMVKEAEEKYNKHISCGLRINPEHSTGEHAIYDPCGFGSRLGITIGNFEKALNDGMTLEGIEGLHFHTLCEQNSDDLETTIAAVEEKFGKYIKGMKWLNFGGGHHITREDYDVERLVKIINYIQDKYEVIVYLEPGEATVLNTGFLVSTVMETFENGMKIAILDTSAACHMPDVIEMPYRPFIINSGMPDEKKYTYRLGGPTCLAGDIIGDYSFDSELKVGDKLVFTDMAHYSMVKNNTFNGINLPDICVYRENEDVKVVKKFGYEDFKSRL